MRVGSIFISFFSVLTTANSFFIAHMFYTLITQSNFLIIYHLLSGFFLVALGTYNLFILYDVWIETEINIPLKGDDALPYRFDDLWNYGGSLLWTLTLTVGLAFMANMASPFRLLSLLGLFGFLLVVVNFLAIMLLMPVVLVLHSLKLSGKRLDCCGKKKPATLDRERRKPPVEFFMSSKMFTHVTSGFCRKFILFFFTLVALASVGLYFVMDLNFEEVSLHVQYVVVIYDLSKFVRP